MLPKSATAPVAARASDRSVVPFSDESASGRTVNRGLLDARASDTRRTIPNTTGTARMVANASTTHAISAAPGTKTNRPLASTTRPAVVIAHHRLVFADG